MGDENTGLRNSPPDPSISTTSSSPNADTPPHSALPPSRSHDPNNNLKRSDPFQFGSRYLLADDDVFEFNAWDHVETDAEHRDYAEAQYAAQRASPVSDFDKKRFNAEPAKWWNQFYKNNSVNFFKDRKWLRQEFPALARATQADGGPITMLEVGAGAGNTAFPILAHNLNTRLKLHACDFSKKAVDLLRAHELYDEKHIHAAEWDVAGHELPPGLGAGSVDLVLMIFIFSALEPSQWRQAVRNIHTLLKPGGEVLLRDYGRGDLAQVRFRKGRYLEENFYVRGDGTRVYFFDRDELASIWEGNDPADTRAEPGTGTGIGTRNGTANAQGVDGDEKKEGKGVEDEEKKEGGAKLFEPLNLGVDRRLLVNRQRKLKMYRCWLQGRFRKVDVRPAASPATVGQG
ncbi:MAG: hypothetical protein M1838_004346 [Thelocarpon superellum]|nr:MAG: hypothetical protein M1838_004346 [Thelocarpon superellum]